MSASDRENYDGYVVTRLNAYREHAGFGGNVWDFGRLMAARKPFTNDDADAFKGPWRSVRPYVTTEFREWVEEFEAERLTFSEWQRAAMEERRAKVSREREYLDSVEYFTDELERWAELTRDRDALIAAARERGASFRVLQSATGLSRMALHNVVTKEARTLAETMAGAEWSIVTPEPVAA